MPTIQEKGLPRLVNGTTGEFGLPVWTASRVSDLGDQVFDL
jgi:hypothetical protein